MQFDLRKNLWKAIRVALLAGLAFLIGIPEFQPSLVKWLLGFVPDQFDPIVGVVVAAVIESLRNRRAFGKAARGNRVSDALRRAAQGAPR